MRMNYFTKATVELQPSHSARVLRWLCGDKEGQLSDVTVNTSLSLNIVIKGMGDSLMSLELR